MTETFSFSSTLSSAWKLIKSNFKFLALAVLATGALYFILNVLQGAAERSVIGTIIVFIITFVVGVMITLGWVNVMLRLIRGNSNKWQDFKTKPRLWANFIVAQVIFMVLVFLAAILIAAPIVMLIASPVAVSLILKLIGFLMMLVGVTLVVWLVIRYFFISYIAVDNATSNGIVILRKAALLTKGHMIDLFGFIVLLALINLAGLLLFFVGLFFTWPLTKVAVAYAYEYLKGKQVSA